MNALLRRYPMFGRAWMVLVLLGITSSVRAGVLAPEAGRDVMFSGLWGWMQTLCFWLLDLLQWLAALTGNWGVAIILVAVLVRAFTYPFARRALRQQKHFNEIQAKLAPKLKEIRQTCKGGEQSERIIELYEDHNVSPSAGMKPLLMVLLQLPIFIALFQILEQAPELRGASFLWLKDLSQPDHLIAIGMQLPWFGSYLNVMPLVLAATIVLATFTAPGDGANAASRKRHYIAAAMAVSFFVIFYSFPAGMVLYWIMANVLHVAQQLLVARKGPDVEGSVA
ncbi:MAG: YidC/Oxa1 family membrane protein insertase [Dokdonella sp.]